MLAIVVAFAAVQAWAQARPAEGEYMDSCAGRDDNSACKTRVGAGGQCAWLTVRERERLNIHTTGSCNAKGRHAGSCHTCTTKPEMDYLGGMAKTEDPNAARKAPEPKKK
jgi:hypothetical protein